MTINLPGAMLATSLAFGPPTTSSPVESSHAISRLQLRMSKDASCEEFMAIGRELNELPTHDERFELLKRNTQITLSQLARKCMRRPPGHEPRKPPKQKNLDGPQASGSTRASHNPLWPIFEQTQSVVDQLRFECKESPEECDTLAAFEMSMIQIGLQALARGGTRKQVDMLLTEIVKSSIGAVSLSRCMVPIVSNLDERIHAEVIAASRDSRERMLEVDPMALNAVIIVARGYQEYFPGLKGVADLKLSEPEKVLLAMEAVDDLVALVVYKNAEAMTEMTGSDPVLRRNRLHLIVAMREEHRREDEASTCQPITDFNRHMTRWFNVAWPSGVRPAKQLDPESLDRVHDLADEMLMSGCMVPACAEKPLDQVESSICRCPHGGVITMTVEPLSAGSSEYRAVVQWRTAARTGVDRDDTHARVVSEPFPRGCTKEESAQRNATAGALAREVASKISLMKKIPPFPPPVPTKLDLRRPSPGKAPLALLSAGAPWLQVDRGDRVGWTLTALDTTLVVGGIAAGSAALILNDLSVRAHQAVPTVNDTMVIDKARLAGSVAIASLSSVMLLRIFAMARYRDCKTRQRPCHGAHWSLRPVMYAGAGTER